jgi:hypothetical protein
VGWRSDPSLTDDAFERIFETTAGIPRRINATCDRLLLFASIEEKHHLNARDVEDTVIDMKKDLMTPFVARYRGRSNEAFAHTADGSAEQSHSHE